jgi:hypothetical protein
VHSADGLMLLRAVERDEAHVTLLTRPWHRQHVVVTGEDMRWATPQKLVDLVTSAVADGAALLRGQVVHDLLLGPHPVNLVGIGDPADLFARCERLSIRLMETAESLRKEM